MLYVIVPRKVLCLQQFHGSGQMIHFFREKLIFPGALFSNFMMMGERVIQFRGFIFKIVEKRVLPPKQICEERANVN